MYRVMYDYVGNYAGDPDYVFGIAEDYNTYKAVQKRLEELRKDAHVSNIDSVSLDYED